MNLDELFEGLLRANGINPDLPYDKMDEVEGDDDQIVFVQSRDWM